MSIEILETHRCFGGEQIVFRHQSEQTGTPMRVSVFTPPGADGDHRAPVLWWLSGLTCTEENFTVKAGAQRYAAEHGLMLVAPDTSPRGEGVPDDAEGAYDFGLGAGFYDDATEAPFAANYRMYSYIVAELPRLIAANFPADPDRQGISGHSMGGHGALTIALKNPGWFRSVSAFAPICAPAGVPWGKKAFSGYLGPDENRWLEHDAVALIEAGARMPDLLVDVGTADPFLDSQLRPDLLEAACQTASIPLTLRRQDGYDHSYFFIASFIGDHVAWHAERLRG
ncbi:MAG: S-formylglutathione hydrolase [Caulobacteraceae bacterium]